LVQNLTTVSVVAVRRPGSATRTVLVLVALVSVLLLFAVLDVALLGQ
jgi:hypothetical protein